MTDTIVIPAKRLVAKPDIQRLRLLCFARNDSQTSFLSLRGVPIHRDDAAILTLATSPKAGIQHRTPGFRLKAGMTTFLAFIENVYIAIQSSIRL